MKGKFVQLQDRGKVVIEEEEVRKPGSGEVLIKTEVTMISPGTERAFLLGLPNTSGEYPARSGYNHVGEVIEAGEGVTGLKVGDRVVSSANHAEYVVRNASGAFPVPSGLSSRKAVFFQMLAIALQGVRKAKVELGDSVLVIGQGLVGNLALQLSRLSGGFPVIAMDTETSRLELSMNCGADHGLDSTDDNCEEALKDCTGGRGASVVIEATGHPEPINLAFQLASRFGRVVILASTRGETKNVNFYRDVHKKGITIYGAHNSARPKSDSTVGFWTSDDDFRVLLELLAADRLMIDPLISHEFDAEDAPEAYQLLMQWDPRLMGSLLIWNREV